MFKKMLNSGNKNGILLIKIKFAPLAITFHLLIFIKKLRKECQNIWS